VRVVGGLSIVGVAGGCCCCRRSTQRHVQAAKYFFSFLAFPVFNSR
jgi:hypothetical protein